MTPPVISHVPVVSVRQRLESDGGPQAANRLVDALSLLAVTKSRPTVHPSVRQTGALEEKMMMMVSPLVSSRRVCSHQFPSRLNIISSFFLKNKRGTRKKETRGGGGRRRRVIRNVNKRKGLGLARHPTRPPVCVCPSAR